MPCTCDLRMHSSRLDTVTKLSAATLDVVDASGECHVGRNCEAKAPRLDDGSFATHDLRLQYHHHGEVMRTLVSPAQHENKS